MRSLVSSPVLALYITAIFFTATSASAFDRTCETYEALNVPPEQGDTVKIAGGLVCGKVRNLFCRCSLDPMYGHAEIFDALNVPEVELSPAGPDGPRAIIKSAGQLYCRRSLETLCAVIGPDNEVTIIPGPPMPGPNLLGL